MLETEHLGFSLSNTAEPLVLPTLCAWLGHQPDSSRSLTPKTANGTCGQEPHGSVAGQHRMIRVTDGLKAEHTFPVCGHSPQWSQEGTNQSPDRATSVNKPLGENSSFYNTASSILKVFKTFGD